MTACQRPSWAPATSGPCTVSGGGEPADGGRASSKPGDRLFLVHICLGRLRLRFPKQGASVKPEGVRCRLESGWPMGWGPVWYTNGRWCRHGRWTDQGGGKDEQAPSLSHGRGGLSWLPLCKHLLSLGHEVVCLDNFYTGRKRNVAQISRPIRLSRSFVMGVPAYLEDGQRSPISPVLPLPSTTSSILSKRRRPASIGSINMLGLAKRLGIRILQASTSEVYGDP